MKPIATHARFSLAVLGVTGATMLAAAGPAFGARIVEGGGGGDACAVASAGATTEELRGLADEYGDFALDLYGALPKAAEQNVILSPYSISTALSMTLAGAKGETASEMHTALRLGAEGQRLHELNAALMRHIGCREDAAYELVTANALWGQKGYRFKPSFLSLLDQSYGAGLKLADFLAAPEPARAEINGWVAERTHERIKDLLPQGAVDSNTRLVLTNAIYYKGAWLYPFAEQLTQTAPFWLTAERSVSVPTMEVTAELPYAASDKAQIVALPIIAKDQDPTPAHELVVIVPKERQGLAALESGLTGAELRDLLSRLEKSSVTLHLPKFHFEADFGLSRSLTALGMERAFDPTRADFTGMYEDGEQPLWISEAFHKGFIDVHEKGIEAAAATAVVMTTTSAVWPTAIVHADRPFLFLIRDVETGAILFLGRVANPS